MPAINDPVEFFFKLITEANIESLPDEKQKLSEKLSPGEIGKTSFCIIIGTKYGDVVLSLNLGRNSKIECNTSIKNTTVKSLLPINQYCVSLDEILRITGYNLQLIKINSNIGEQIEELSE